LVCHLVLLPSADAAKRRDQKGDGMLPEGRETTAATPSPSGSHRLNQAVVCLPTKLQDVTKKDIRTLIASVSDTGKLGAARALFTTLSAFFNFCVREDYLQHSPMNGFTVAPRPARDRALTDQEIRSVWSGALQMGYPFGPLYQLLLLTGQRRDEVGMAWSDIDLQKGTWTIPKSKTKNAREHIVHLSPQAVV
jgi:integrase